MKRIATLLIAITAFSACGDTAPTTVVLLTHDFFAIPEELSTEFTATTGYELEIVRGGDAGIVVNQAVLSAGNPVADVLFGVDTTLLSRTVTGDVFTPYRSNGLDAVPEGFHLDGDIATPIDIGDVCLNYDIAAVPRPPATLRDLTRPDFAGTLVVPDPTISTPGLAFMLATIATFGESGGYTWLDFWQELRDNDVSVVADWGTAYYGSFSGAGPGDRPIVVSYASSPPAEVLFADPPIDTATTAVIEAGCFRQIEYAGVLRGADNRAGAEAFIDFMLGSGFQESVATSMFVFPIRPDIDLPSVFTDTTVIPGDPVTIDADAIEQNRERWLAEWTGIVLR